MDTLTDKLKRHLDMDKEMADLVEMKQKLEADIVHVCIKDNMLDCFSLNIKKLRRYANLPPHHKHL